MKRGRNDRFTGSDSNVLAAQLDRGWWERLEWKVSCGTGSNMTGLRSAGSKGSMPVVGGGLSDMVSG